MNNTEVKTPGYNCRLSIFFLVGKSKRAFYWDVQQFRAFPMKLVEAELFIAQGQADELASDPRKEQEV